MRLLRRAFYAAPPAQQEQQPSQERQQQAPSPSAQPPTASDSTASADASTDADADVDAADCGGGTLLVDVPLWRPEFAVLPGGQCVLHVHRPHYLHMFDELLAAPASALPTSAGGPRVFGHLYLPGGSASLGAPGSELAAGSSAPLVGVLMEVTRAARLRDGKLLVLATAVARFRVVRARRELPYSRADVELLADAEELLAREAMARDAAVEVRAVAMMCDVMCWWWQ